MLPTITFSLQSPHSNNKTTLPTIFVLPTSNHSTPITQLQPKQISSNSILPSKYVNNYVIDYNRQIGHGNFSHVYAAIDKRQPNNKLAVKVVDVEKLRLQNLQPLIKSQVQVLLAVRHENIILCKDAFWDQKYCYIFTQFCEQGSLQSKINKSIPAKQNSQIPQMMQSCKFPNLSEKQMLPIIKDIFQGLLYLQKRHIIHRDIKAANIFLKQNSAVIADFGFAKFFNQPFLDLNIGSLPFMPPQAITKSLYSKKTDVWAFGALVYEIFHGGSPFSKATQIQQLIQKVHTPLNITMIRNDLSTQMKQLILSCLQIDMEKRRSFVEIQKTWFYKKLFQNMGQHNYGYRVNRVSQLNIVKNVNIIDEGSTASSRNQKQSVNQINKNNLTVNNRLSIPESSNGYTSRFKVKSNGFIEPKFDLSSSKSKGKDNQAFYQPNTINFLTPNKSINFVTLTNTQPISPIISINNPTSINIIPSPTPSQNLIKIQSQKPIQKFFKSSFKQILLKIQQIRNYFKLAIILKDRNQRLTQIKNRLFIKSVKEINKIQNLLQNDRIDLSAYDSNNSKQKTKTQQQIQSNNATVRKVKLTSIIKDYKTEFQTQLKRRSLNLKNNIPDFLTQKDVTKDNKSLDGQNNDNKNINTSVKNNNFKSKVPVMSQDIEYIMQTQLLYHAEDTLQMTYDQCQAYRSKIKQVLQDIMHVQHGYLNQQFSTIKQKQQRQKNIIKSTQQIPTYIQNNSGNLIVNGNQQFFVSPNKNYDVQQLSRLRWKQKSIYL